MTFNPAAIAVSRWQLTLLGCALLIALGVSAFLSIPRTEDPQLNAPTFMIQAVLPGATPAEVEQLVTKPIEDALYGLDSVRQIRSTSGDGISSTYLEFIWGANPESRYDEVSREVNNLRTTLPAGLTRLEVNRVRPTEVSIIQVALVSDQLPMRRFAKLADHLRERIASVPGVREAKYWGAPKTEMRVAVDLGRLASLRLPVNAVLDALRAGGAETPIGSINAGQQRFNVRYAGAYPDAATVRAIPVVNRAGTVIRVGDVAQIDWADQEADYVTRFNGKRALFVSATQGDGQDVAQVTQGIDRQLRAFERTLPAGVKLERAFAQADNVSNRLGKLARDFLLAFVIVLLTLLPLGLRPAIVVMIAIPLSLLTGIAILSALGYTLNQLSVAGLVLSLGLLVDDAIVVTENIARFMREGADRVTAAIQGTRQITLAVAGCTACLMFAFLPLMALPEATGEFIRSLPVAVLATVAGSFLVAMTVIPFAASRFLKGEKSHDGNPLLRGLNTVIHRVYRPVLHRSLERPWRALGVLGLVAALAFPLLGLVGSSLFPAAEMPQFLIRVETPQGSAMARTDQALRFVEQRLTREPDVKWAAANVGRGNPQLYYNTPQRETDPAFGEVAVSLKQWRPGRSDQLIERLRADLARYPGAKISVQPFVQGPATDAPIEIRISGPNLETLAALARKAERTMTAMPELRDIGNPLRIDRTDLTLGVDEARAAGLGVPAGALRQTAQLALSGAEAARLRDADGDSYPVTVRLPMNGRNEVAALGQIFVPSADGAALPLSAVSRPTLTSGPARIDRLDRTRTVTVTAYVQPGVLVSRATQAAAARVRAATDLPPGYTLSLGGEAETQARSFAGLGPAITIAVVGILGVLVLEFGRFRTVAVVAGIIPLGLFGALAALWLTGNSLSFTATIGLIALIGIEIKNSILLVDFTEQLRREGVGVRAAIERAGELRFLPVLLTSITAIGGLLPLAIEGNGLYSPMAIAMIGGLVSSTLLSRIATPVMYLLLAGGDLKKDA